MIIEISLGDKCVIIESNSIVIGIILIKNDFYETWFDNHNVSLFF